ncbi:PilW family protein [Microbacterium sp. NPDC003461]
MTRPLPRDERGFTLVELLVFCVVLGMVLIAGVSLLLSAYRGSALVTGTSESVMEGQNAARTISGSVRDATHITVSDTGDFLATAAGPEGDRECRAWFVWDDPADEPDAGATLYARLSPSPIDEPAAENPDLGDWFALATHVRPDGDLGVFSLVDRDAPPEVRDLVPDFASKPGEQGVLVRFGVGAARNAAFSTSDPTVIHTYATPRLAKKGDNPCA